MDLQNMKILIVDDVSDNIQVAMNILKEENYLLSFAMDGFEALELIKTEEIDLILLDIMMPKLDGFEVCRRIKLLDEKKDIPIIFLTAKTDIDSIAKGFKLGGVDFITKPFHPEEILARVKNHLELYNAKKLLQVRNVNLSIKANLQQERLIKELEDNQREMIYILMEMMELTSDETGQHIKRVAEISKLLAHYSDKLTEDDEVIIYHASPMHDIGKIAIPKEILHKPDQLTPAEFEIMKTHAEKGGGFLKNSHRKLFKAAAIIAHEHHEKWDGSGYPRGLKGTDIHIYGRIVALADVFDALTHKRTYKESWSVDNTIAYIKDNSGTHFDPQLVETFIEHLDEFIAIGSH